MFVNIFCKNVVYVTFIYLFSVLLGRGPLAFSIAQLLAVVHGASPWSLRFCIVFGIYSTSPCFVTMVVASSTFLNLLQTVLLPVVCLAVLNEVESHEISFFTL